MCPVLFPTQINSISLISNGPFWDLQAAFKQHDGLCLRMPPRSRIPSVTNITILHNARALIPITWDELAGRFSSHARTFFFHIQVSEFNTADTIPLLFKGKIFPFISRPLYIITQSKLRAELHSDAVDRRQNKYLGEVLEVSLLLWKGVCPRSSHPWDGELLRTQPDGEHRAITQLGSGGSGPVKRYGCVCLPVPAATPAPRRPRSRRLITAPQRKRARGEQRAPAFTGKPDENGRAADAFQGHGSFTRTIANQPQSGS